MKRITIYDVAKEADVSLATVSRVINDEVVVEEDHPVHSGFDDRLNDILHASTERNSRGISAMMIPTRVPTIS